jgi:F0F1-type ATP synthase assembly protein I
VIGILSILRSAYSEVKREDLEKQAPTEEAKGQQPDCVTATDHLQKKENVSTDCKKTCQEINNAAGGFFSRLGRALKHMFTKNAAVTLVTIGAGATIGATVGTFAGGIGAPIGLAIGAVAGFLTALRSAYSEIKKEDLEKQAPTEGTAPLNLGKITDPNPDPEETCKDIQRTTEGFLMRAMRSIFSENANTALLTISYGATIGTAIGAFAGGIGAPIGAAIGTVIGFLLALRSAHSNVKMEELEKQSALQSTDSLKPKEIANSNSNLSEACQEIQSKTENFFLRTLRRLFLKDPGDTLQMIGAVAGGGAKVPEYAKILTESLSRIHPAIGLAIGAVVGIGIEFVMVYLDVRKNKLKEQEIQGQISPATA